MISTEVIDLCAGCKYENKPAYVPCGTCPLCANNDYKEGEEDND